MGFVALQRSVGSSSKTFVLVQVMSTLTHFAHLHQEASPPRPGLGGGPRMDGPQVGQEGWSEPATVPGIPSGGPFWACLLEQRHTPVPSFKLR